jgi:lactoylglutathione lyase
MKFGYTIIYVNSVKDTVEFYELAFGFKRLFIADANEYGELDTGGTKLAFASNSFVKTILPHTFEEASLDKPAPPIELGFVTEQVEDAFQRAIAAGAIEIKKPALKPWGQLVGYVRDINGFLIEICSPVSND